MAGGLALIELKRVLEVMVMRIERIICIDVLGLIGVTGDKALETEGGWVIGEPFVGEVTEREDRLRERDEEVRSMCWCWACCGCTEPSA